MPTLALYLFGALDVTWGEQALPKPPTLKSQSLLAYLASHRAHPQSRSRLAGLLWGDRPEQKARASLSTSLWHIRRCLPHEESIVGDLHSVQFNPDLDIWLDTEEFEARTSNGDTRQLEMAVSLCRGDFLEAFYDGWVIEERYRLAARCCNALARLMLKQEGEGLYLAALETAGRLLERDPLREDAHCVAMRAYCRLGQRAQALEQYRHCREALVEELGVEPAAETTEYYQAILEGRVEIGRPIPARAMRRETIVPALGGGDPLDVAAVSPLVGREEELCQLDRHWRCVVAGQGSLLLVRGEAGVGKTRLLREFAARLPSRAARVLWGRCYEFERLLPYQPLAEALQGCRPDLETGDQPAWVYSEVERLFPEAADEWGAAPSRGHAEPVHTRMFEGVVAFLAWLGRQRPCLLVFDDLHWASESTLQMLHYLVRH
ncbi:MAG: AAA family ATPase, partial [Anaerolineae bacterium]